MSSPNNLQFSEQDHNDDLPSTTIEESALEATATDVPSSSPFSDKLVDDRLEAAVAFAKLVGRLKTTPRMGWPNRGVPRYESVADHSWRVSILAFLLKDEEDIDFSTCLEMALIHDMAESLTGDITPDDGIPKSEKHQMEADAMNTIASVLNRAKGSTEGSQRLLAMFDTYEERESNEAKAVKDLDMLDFIIQADEYEECFGTDLSDFFDATPPSKFHLASLRQVAEKVHEIRRLRLEKETASEKQGDEKTENSLEDSDREFVEDFTAASGSSLEISDVTNVVRALRQWEASQ